VENRKIEIAGEVPGKILAEIDVITKNAVVQYKDGPRSAFAIITQVRKIERFVDRPIVVFIKDTSKAGMRTVRSVGGKVSVTNDFDLLVSMIK